MINAEIRQFRNSLVAMTNASPLPIEIKRLVFEEVQRQIAMESERVIAEEKQQAESNKDTEEKQQAESNKTTEESEEKEHE